MTEQQKAELDALQTLIDSQGWKFFDEMVVKEIAADFEEHITRALDVSDGPIAVDRMRQIAAVRKAGQRWLSLPKKRVDTLKQLIEQKDDREAEMMSRRPVGL